jgi:hypothetical protein
MGCAGSRPDPSVFLVAQPKPASPIGPVAGGDASTSDYASVTAAITFMELELKASPQSQLKGGLAGVAAPQKDPKIEAAETAGGGSLLSQVTDRWGFPRRQPVTTFFGADSKVIALLTTDNCDSYANGRGEGVLYSARASETSGGHPTKTAADGTVLHAVAKIKPRFAGGMVPYQNGLALYPAGHDGEFKTDLDSLQLLMKLDPSQHKEVVNGKGEGIALLDGRKVIETCSTRAI